MDPVPTRVVASECVADADAPERPRILAPDPAPGRRGRAAGQLSTPALEEGRALYRLEERIVEPVGRLALSALSGASATRRGEDRDVPEPGPLLEEREELLVGGPVRNRVRPRVHTRPG